MSDAKAAVHVICVCGCACVLACVFACVRACVRVCQFCHNKWKPTMLCCVNYAITLRIVLINQLKMTYSMTTSSPNLDVDFNTLGTEFQNASYQNENTTDVGNATSLGHGMPSPNFYVITTLATIGIAGVFSNVAVLAVLFQKENRKLATNRYLINLAISESTLSLS